MQKTFKKGQKRTKNEKYIFRKQNFANFKHSLSAIDYLF